MSQKEDKKKSLEEELNRIQNDNQDLVVSNYIAQEEDIPDFGSIEIYDYNKDVEDSNKSAKELMESLFEFYFKDVPGIKENKYLMKKIEEDALVYAESIFLQKMTRRNFIKQLSQVDSGSDSARHHEVINDTVSQIRDNIKFSQSQRTELEKYYKEMRKDYDEMLSHVDPVETGDGEDGGKIYDARTLNDIIDKAMKSRI
jgi:hypothetical protein